MPSELVAALSDPGFYPHGPPTVDVRETHISFVFLAGELVYKLKKPVVLPFVDYGTVDRRRWMCREEVRLNRRLAPDVYLGVRAVVRADGGMRLADEGEPGALGPLDELAACAHLQLRSDRPVAELVDGVEAFLDAQPPKCP